MRPISPRATVKTAADGVLIVMIFSVGVWGSAGPDERARLLATFLPVAAGFYVVGLWMRRRWGRGTDASHAERIGGVPRWIVELVTTSIAFVLMVLMGVDPGLRVLMLTVGLPAIAALLALGRWSERGGRQGQATRS